jgi:NAD(P)-dependent dehydrogenase (short-subunit alcohol dehydrogenase family)
MFSLKNKTAVVTGGGSGIGKEIAALFARQGAVVYVIDINGAGGDHVHFKKCDISVKEETDKTIKDIIAEAGSLDIVVNNAGIAHVGNVEQVTPEALNLLIGVNIKGVYHMLQACIPHLKKRGGVVLNMASVASLVGLADRFAYSMTKGAVASMTLSIAKDYLVHGIRCNSISPARVHTAFVDGFLAKNYPGREEEMFRKLETSQPIGRMARPEEIACLALYLCSDEAAFITGCDYPIDGGFTKLNS